MQTRFEPFQADGNANGRDHDHRDQDAENDSGAFLHRDNASSIRKTSTFDGLEALATITRV